MARKLLLVPVLVVASFVTVLEAPAGNGNAGGWKSYDEGGQLTTLPPGWYSHRPSGTGDGRRIK